MKNQSPDDVTISYLANGEMREQNITKYSVSNLMVSLTSDGQPGDITFKAFKQGTNTVVRMNGMDSLIVTPTEAINTILATIGEGE